MTNSTAKDIQLSVADLTGSEIYSGNILSSENKNEFTLNGLRLKEGIYLLKIRSGSSSQIKKLVVN